jgi:hypothetical protein
LEEEEFSEDEQSENNENLEQTEQNEAEPGVQEEFDSVFSAKEISYLKKLSLHERAQLLFSIVYLASRQVSEEDIQPLFQHQTKNPVSLESLVNELRTELNSRNAPYTINWNKEQKYVEIQIKQEIINEISFSDYFFKIENLPREKHKILSFITFKLYLEHSHCSVDDLLLMKNTFGFDELKLAKILYDLEQENLIYQIKRGSASDIHLTNQFFDVMGLPMDRFQLGPVLRNELIKVLQGDSLVEDEEEIIEELEEEIEEENTSDSESSEQEPEGPGDTINDLLKSLDGEG